MDQTLSRICTLCARGGSKGVLNKNIRMLLGKPLIAHSIAQALESGLFSAIAVSSDSEEILQAAANAGATLLVRRPAELATDTAAKLPVIQHCLLTAERMAGRQFDVVVDLDATSPLRSAADIAAAVQLLHDTDAQNVITAMPARRSPYFNQVELDSAGHVHLAKQLDKPVVRRQDAPASYDMNASIYAWRREALLEGRSVFMARTRLYVMPEERSIDIDSELDFRFVEFLFSERREG